MKKIIKPSVEEIAEYFCDSKGCKKPAVSRFRLNFGYGSDFDFQTIKGDFCNKHSRELKEYLLNKYENLEITEDFV